MKVDQVKVIQDFTEELANSQPSPKSLRDARRSCVPAYRARIVASSRNSWQEPMFGR
jgi:hypothetical protein